MSDRRRALGRGLGALISNSGSNSARSETEEPASPAPVDSSSGEEASDGVTWLRHVPADPLPEELGQSHSYLAAGSLLLG